MHRLTIGSIAALAAVAVSVSPVVAQKPKPDSTKTTGEEIGQVIDKTRFELRPGGGVTFPLGSDFFDTGWHLGGSIRGTPRNFPLAFQLDLFYHDLGEKAVAAADSVIDSSFLQLSLDAVYPLTTASPSFDPYLIGGVGLYDGNFGLNAGVGADFRLRGSGVGLFAELRIHRIFSGEPEDVSLFPITVGVRIPL